MSLNSIKGTSVTGSPNFVLLVCDLFAVFRSDVATNKISFVNNEKKKMESLLYVRVNLPSSGQALDLDWCHWYCNTRFFGFSLTVLIGWFNNGMFQPCHIAVNKFL